MRINHSELQSARAISLAELSDLLPECAFVTTRDGVRDPGGRPSRNQWEELHALSWLDPDCDESDLLA